MRRVYEGARRRGPLAGRAALPVLLLVILAPAVLAQAPGPTLVRFVIPRLEVTPLHGADFTLEEGERGELRFLVVNRADVPARFFVQATEIVSPLKGPSLGVLVEPSAAELGPNESLVATVHLFAFRGNLTSSDVGFDLFAEGGVPLGNLVTRVQVAAPAPVDVPEPSGGLSRGGIALALAVAAGVGLWGAWHLVRRDRARHLAALALVPLYTRLAPSKLLDQEKRDALHRLIAAEPGIHYSALKERTGLPAGVLVHHLRTLERHRLVVSRRDGAYRRYAPVAGAFPEAPPAPVTPMQARVLGLLAGSPMTQRQIAEALGLSQQGANRHVKALERRGLLAIRFEAGEWRCHAVREAAAPAAE